MIIAAIELLVLFFFSHLSVMMGVHELRHYSRLRDIMNRRRSQKLEQAIVRYRQAAKREHVFLDGTNTRI